jgi:hypothetical protein
MKLQTLLQIHQKITKMAKRTDPNYETKQNKEFSREGINLRDLLRVQSGLKEGQELTRADFDRSLSSAGLSRKNMRKLGKAFDTIQNNPNLDYIVSQDGSGFNVFDKTTGAAQTTSGRAKGNTKGINLADLIGLGDNVSKLAGYAAGAIPKYNQSLPVTVPTKQEPLSKKDIAPDDAVEVTFVPPANTAAKSSNTKTASGNKAASSTKAAIEDTLPAYNPGEFESKLREFIEGSNPNRFRGVTDPSRIRNEFDKKFAGLASSPAYYHGPMSVSPQSIKANTKGYSDMAVTVYEEMVRDGITPDIDEIASLIENNELEMIREGLSNNLNTTLTVMTLGRLGSVGIRGMAKGIQHMSTKYPNFAKWMAKKGIGKNLNTGVPQKVADPSISLRDKAINRASNRMVEEAGSLPKLPTVSKGAKDYLGRLSTIKKRSAQMAESFEKGGKLTVKSLMNC